MAVLTASGINFGNSTSLNSRYGIIPQNSVTLFYQSTTPTGWTKLTTQNNKALRVVSGTGGGAGGTSAFTTAFNSKTISVTVPVSGTVNATNLSVAQIPSHTHPASTVAAGAHTHPYGRLTINPGGVQFRQEQPTHPRTARTSSNVETGAAGNHTHPLTVGATGGSPAPHGHPWSGSGPFSSTMNFAVQYIDVIFCSFN
jgi:hypothetical protein